MSENTNLPQKPAKTKNPKAEGMPSRKPDQYMDESTDESLKWHLTSKDGGRDWITTVSKQAEELDGSLRSFVSRRPITAALAAVGVGLLGNFLIKRFGNAPSETAKTTSRNLQ